MVLLTYESFIEKNPDIPAFSLFCEIFPIIKLPDVSLREIPLFILLTDT